MDGTYKRLNSLLDQDCDQDESSIFSLKSHNDIQNISYRFSSELNLISPQISFADRQNRETEREIGNIFYPANDYNIIDVIDDNRHIFIEPKKEIAKKRIFKIIKISKKRGRRSNSYKEKHKEVKYVHDKTSNDNIIRKIKTYFTKALLEFVNFIYEKEYQRIFKDLKKVKTPWLQKLSRDVIKPISIDENLKWLNMKVKDFLSSQVSTKNKHYEIGYNAKKIKKVLDEGKMTELIDILNKDIIFFLEIYATKNGENNSYSAPFTKIDEDFNEEKAEDEEEKEYIKTIKDVAKNFKEIYKNKTTRRK